MCILEFLHIFYLLFQILCSGVHLDNSLVNTFKGFYRFVGKGRGSLVLSHYLCFEDNIWAYGQHLLILCLIWTNFRQNTGYVNIVGPMVGYGLGGMKSGGYKG